MAEEVIAKWGNHKGQRPNEITGSQDGPSAIFAVENREEDKKPNGLCNADTAHEVGYLIRIEAKASE